jgi:hypothetical protein
MIAAMEATATPRSAWPRLPDWGDFRGGKLFLPSVALPPGLLFSDGIRASSSAHAKHPTRLAVSPITRTGVREFGKSLGQNRSKKVARRGTTWTTSVRKHTITRQEEATAGVRVFGQEAANTTDFGGTTNVLACRPL